MRRENERLLDYFRHSERCEICGKPTPQGCDPHHVFKRGMGGGSRLDIACCLLSACRPCHEDCESGKVSRERQIKTIADREGLLPGDVLGAIYRMRMRPKDYVFDPERESA